MCSSDLHSGASETLAAFAARFGTAAGVRRPSPSGSVEPESPAAVSEAAPESVDIHDAVERLISLRAAARAERRYVDADAIREAIEALGVEVTDAAAGATWRVRP